jgi:hypothetical protein
LVCFDTEGETFFSQIFTGNETWVHHFEPVRKESNPWNGTNFDLPGSKKFKNFLSVGKVTITLFWDCEGVVLVTAVLIGETVSCDAYIRTLTEYRKHFKQV